MKYFRMETDNGTRRVCVAVGKRAGRVVVVNTKAKR